MFTATLHCAGYLGTVSAFLREVHQESKKPSYFSDRDLQTPQLNGSNQAAESGRDNTSSVRRFVSTFKHWMSQSLGSSTASASIDGSIPQIIKMCEQYWVECTQCKNQHARLTSCKTAVETEIPCWLPRVQTLDERKGLCRECRKRPLKRKASTELVKDAAKASKLTPGSSPFRFDFNPPQPDGERPVKFLPKAMKPSSDCGPPMQSDFNPFLAFKP